ncbi:MAG: acetyl-CoA carboxylase carboxyltransferase subunit alpha [Flavobacteriaceae bacterium]|nr:acetyl-CoA carboxylase carboxyltransferase subunit alpha [Flavobacteriaceae bacterium]MCY4266686.1 acetyl-CoA carboxylase carboxyltransferase subunit alpha [Flavobacteriaceae bacterium]MCY4299727.1 acetyl-CoA carboxylase carboxyltransferase subunit alpha [Flavobacteriaceae bacterium]
MEYLEFEKPVMTLNDQLHKCLELGKENGVDVSDTVKQLKEKIESTKKEIYKNLTPWQKVQLSRHPNRPYTLDYIKALCGSTFLELHGDRNIADDKAMVGGIGKISGQSFMIIGTQKGYDTQSRQYRNFGMANPQGYRKALRLMKSAEKFQVPILTLIDTPGAFPGIEAEERGQGEAIARNIYEMMNLQVPIIVTIIGEGASGGALGIGVGDRILMLENTWYSVISPESCSSILWRSWDHKEEMAQQLKLTAQDMKTSKIIDSIVKEPLGGAHYDRKKMFATLQKQVTHCFDQLKRIPIEELLKQRRNKYSKIGNFTIEE